MFWWENLVWITLHSLLKIVLTTKLVKVLKYNRTFRKRNLRKWQVVYHTIVKAYRVVVKMFKKPLLIHKLSLLHSRSLRIKIKFSLPYSPKKINNNSNNNKQNSSSSNNNKQSSSSSNNNNSLTNIKIVTIYLIFVDSFKTLKTGLKRKQLDRIWQG